MPMLILVGLIALSLFWWTFLVGFSQVERRGKGVATGAVQDRKRMRSGNMG